jgi:hypothetical protein
VLLASSLVVGHDLELIWLPELLERPYDAKRSPGVFAVKNAQGAVDNTAPPRRPRATIVRTPRAVDVPATTAATPITPTDHEAESLEGARWSDPATVGAGG